MRYNDWSSAAEAGSHSRCRCYVVTIGRRLLKLVHTVDADATLLLSL